MSINRAIENVIGMHSVLLLISRPANSDPPVFYPLRAAPRQYQDSPKSLGGEVKVERAAWVVPAKEFLLCPLGAPRRGDLVRFPGGASGVVVDVTSGWSHGEIVRYEIIVSMVDS